MEMKLFALDMDGTLLQPDHKTISDMDKKTIETAIDQGFMFVPATGRMRDFIPMPVKEIKGWQYAITSNGAAVYDFLADTLIYSDYLSAKLIAQIIAVLNEYQVFYEIYADGKSFIEKQRLAHAEFYYVPKQDIPFFRQKGTAVSSMQDFLKEAHGFEKIYIPYIPAAIHQALKNQLQQYEVAITSSVGTNLEVNSKTANKGAALAALCAHLGHSVRHAMAVGDNDNDLSMIQMAGVGVAMGNAETFVKEQSDYITKSNVEHGVSHAIKKYFLAQD